MLKNTNVSSINKLKKIVSLCIMISILGVSSEPEKRIVMLEGKTIIEMHKNGSVVKDVPINNVYYYSNEDNELFQGLKKISFRLGVSSHEK